MNIIWAIALLIFMFFAHLVDDYYLQGWLASAKQKSWWEKNAPQDLYRHDYLAALVCHALSWSCMICFPFILYMLINHVDKPLLSLLYLAIPINCVIHAIVDDLKANKRKINLITDQSIHAGQIIITWIVACICLGLFN